MSILTNVKSLLHLSDTDSDTILSNIIALSKKTFTNMTGYYVDSTTNVTETVYPYNSEILNTPDYGSQLSTSFYASHGGNSGISKIFFTTNYSAIVSVDVDGTTKDSSRYTYDTTDYSLTFLTSTGTQEYINFSKYIKITATKGFDSEDDLPSDVQMIISFMTVSYYKQLGENNYTTVDGNILTPDNTNLPASLVDLIWNYKITA